jgi:hypothetical protein
MLITPEIIKYKKERLSIFTKTVIEPAIKTIIMAVPKSGCFTIRTKGIIISKKGLISSRKVKPVVFACFE